MKQTLGIALLSSALITACSSTPKMANGTTFEPDRVLSTQGDTAMPAWAQQGEGEPFLIRDGRVASVGIVTIRDGERPEAAVRMAETNARANIAKAISNRMEYLFQGAEENYGFDSTQAKFIGSEASSLTTHSMHVSGHWWKRYMQVNESGERHIYYAVYALITEPESELKQAIFEATHEAEHRHQLSKAFEDQVNKQWDRFVSGEAKSDHREPTANTNEPADKSKD